jgi:hypothetical protein
METSRARLFIYLFKKSGTTLAPRDVMLQARGSREKKNAPRRAGHKSGFVEQFGSQAGMHARGQEC